MWPRKLDLNQDECNSMLRQIELDCYSSVITAFRAQGGLDDLKTRILADLRKIFHIDEDRHKAEARRVANDEELTTIADLVFGESASSEWRNEGRRTNGLLQRAPAQTAFCKMSNNIKEDATNMNSLL
uniref:ENT domain-containing protein n=1 Tax=Megaselia scalaris TaxID=36166 RepID=T1GYH3_MEGSC